MKRRVYSVKTASGEFEFFADSPALAAEHTHQLADDPGFKQLVRYQPPRFERWQEDGTLQHD